jgi:hypothetical protein
MRRAFLTILVIANSAFAQAPQKLTPTEAREGWILLFDGESTLGWDVEGDVKIQSGRILTENGGKLTWRGQAQKADTVANGVSAAIDLTKKSGQIVLTASTANLGNIATVKLRPIGAQPLFNGKDLSGWKIFDGKKSKFDVKDGILSIENGPGDLQTEASYKNFLLQLECRTNGKHLNSGVFFRCRAGEYQNGYEAQINNNFTAGPPKDYVVDEYDPKTNKLLDKKKVKSTAADFGTGSIYRRIPTTKDIAKDGEWFTLTVLAHGNHFATWVNGIQTVEWYDNRPPNDNARNGYRSEGGHISLQGHDPTTNLSFRNIRIAKLPD